MNEEEIIQELGYISTNVDEKGERAIHAFVDLYNQEKEKNKKLEEEEELNEVLIDMYFEKEEVYNKVIDMMAEEILKITKANDISNYLKQFSNYDIDFIKQYYFKKARGEEE